MLKILKNKRAEYSGWMAFKAIIIISIYFSLFTIGVNSVENVEQKSYMDDGFIYDEYLSNIEGMCTNPRTIYQKESENKIDVESYDKPSNTVKFLDCEITQGVTGEDKCEQIEGCNWTTIESGWWFWGSSYETCTGSINFTYYNISEAYKITGAGSMFNPEKVTNYESGERYYAVQDETPVSVCELNKSQENNNLCSSIFGCEYYTSNELENMGEKELSVKTGINTGTSFMETFTNMLSFKYDFGFDEHNLLTTLLNLIFIGIPFLILTGSITFLVFEIIRLLPFT